MTPFVANITNLLSLGIIAMDILAVFLLLLLISPRTGNSRAKKVADFLGENALTFAFLVALASVLGSLFYSEIAGFQPCLLCWWQRILLYPQALILLIALIKRDEAVRKYCLAFSGIGALVSVYHTYIQFGGNDLIPCTTSGVSCQHVYFVTYGYITIPTMALTAFVLILLFLAFKKPGSRA